MMIWHAHKLGALSLRRTLATISFTDKNGVVVVGRDSRRLRHDPNAERREKFEEYLASIARPAAPQTRVAEPTGKIDQTRGEVWRKEERKFLFEEAGVMARSLFRTCLRSINVMRPGNEHDEMEFRAREEKQFSKVGDDAIDMFSVQPPVNRDNELTSRVNYYHAHLREHINSDSQCLNADPWTESDIATFLHFLRTGEKRRRYVLKDYRFEDPYKSVFDDERIKKFEERANALIHDTYKANGWILTSERMAKERRKDLDSSFGYDIDPEGKEEYF